MQPRSQSPRYPCPAERESFTVPLDKGNARSGNEIGVGGGAEFKLRDKIALKIIISNISGERDKK